MQYRRFGRTELKMPVLSCGGMRYQHSWSDVDPKEIKHSNQDNLEAIVKRALELGINHIETARGYGTSELQLGRILPTLPREQMIVQTKVCPTPSPKIFRKTFERSIKDLQLDYVDLLGIHGINTVRLKQDTLRNGGILDEAKQLRDKGLIRHIGFSTHAPLEVILELIETDEFEYVNLHWYYVDQVNRQAIEAARRKDMGVFIISPNDKGGKLYNPSAKLVELCQPLHPMVFNDLFCLANPKVHTISVGAAKPSDFDKHLESVALLDRADELLPPMLERFEKNPGGFPGARLGGSLGYRFAPLG